MVGPRDDSVEVTGFSWDYEEDGNIKHIARHRVSRSDLEEVGSVAPRFFRNSRTEGASHVMIAPNRKGRFMRAAIVEGPMIGKWYVVTAHWLSRRRGERLYDS